MLSLAKLQCIVFDKSSESGEESNLQKAFCSIYIGEEFDVALIF